MVSFTRAHGLGTWIRSAPVIYISKSFVLLHLITDGNHHSNIVVPYHLLPADCRHGDTLKVCYRIANENELQILGAKHAKYVVIKLLSRTPAKLVSLRGTVWKLTADEHVIIKDFENPAPGGVTRCRMSQAMFRRFEPTEGMRVDLIVAYSADTKELIARVVKKPFERFFGEYDKFN